MNSEREIYESINRIADKGQVSKAESILEEFILKVNSKPSYAGYYFRALSFFRIDKNKYASNIIEDIDSASKYRDSLPNKESFVPALLLKAKAFSHLQEYDKGISTCDEILKIRAEADAYFIRGILTVKKTHSENDGWDDVKRAADLGSVQAKKILQEVNSRRKKQ